MCAREKELCDLQESRNRWSKKKKKYEQNKWVEAMRKREKKRIKSHSDDRCWLNLFEIYNIAYISYILPLNWIRIWNKMHRDFRQESAWIVCENSKWKEKKKILCKRAGDTIHTVCLPDCLRDQNRNMCDVYSPNSNRIQRKLRF